MIPLALILCSMSAVVIMGCRRLLRPRVSESETAMTARVFRELSREVAKTDPDAALVMEEYASCARRFDDPHFSDMRASIQHRLAFIGFPHHPKYQNDLFRFMLDMFRDADVL